MMRWFEIAAGILFFLGAFILIGSLYGLDWAWFLSPFIGK